MLLGCMKVTRLNDFLESKDGEILLLSRPKLIEGVSDKSLWQLLRVAGAVRNDVFTQVKLAA